MRPPRFRTRSLMIATVLLALTMAAGRAWQHWQVCRERAEHHSSQERIYRAFAEAAAQRAALIDGGAEGVERWEKFARQCWARTVAHATCKRNFDRAASRFWLPVPADSGVPYAAD